MALNNSKKHRSVFWCKQILIIDLKSLNESKSILITIDKNYKCIVFFEFENMT